MSCSLIWSYTLHQDSRVINVLLQFYLINMSHLKTDSYYSVFSHKHVTANKVTFQTVSHVLSFVLSQWNLPKWAKTNINTVKLTGNQKQVDSSMYPSVRQLVHRATCTGRDFCGNRNSALHITNVSQPPHMPPAPSHPSLYVVCSNPHHKTCSCSPWREDGVADASSSFTPW